MYLIGKYIEESLTHFFSSFLISFCPWQHKKAELGRTFGLIELLLYNKMLNNFRYHLTKFFFYFHFFFSPLLWEKWVRFVPLLTRFILLGFSRIYLLINYSVCQLILSAHLSNHLTFNSSSLVLYNFKAFCTISAIKTSFRKNLCIYSSIYLTDWKKGYGT